MAGTKIVMKCRSQDEAKYTEVYAPILRKDGSVTNVINIYDDDDFRSFGSEESNKTYTDISGAIVDMTVTQGGRTSSPRTVEVCGANNLYYIVLIDDVYWSVYKTQTRFYVHNE